MRNWHTLVLGTLALGVTACTQELQSAFLTVTEEFGNLSGSDVDGGGSGAGGGSGTDGTARFRDEMTITFANTLVDGLNVRADLNTSLVAWVLPSSIRSAEQQDALLANGYVQLSSQLNIGTAFTLPPGTFILNGEGTAGARRILLAPGEAETVSIITPDVIMFYDQPPVSCDSVAFYYTDGGFLVDEFEVGSLTFDDSRGLGPRKVLSQVDAYSCQPLQPGLFLRTTGGAANANEFREGQDVTVVFSILQLANGFWTQVTIN